eukprot:NODE_188_length_1843_cov_708.989933.p1 GENE.NODE_188_length_1843_cov_708.989933~~NODE_188_length_1843_cov_708.989933.p1  ORF type:complete len:539 (+),score=172.80 NODE_188_length_1843_cov_708.989933:3-1619(+)
MGVPTGSWTSTARQSLKSVCTTTCPQSTSGGVSIPAKRAKGLCPADMYDNGWCSWYNSNTTRIADYCIDATVFSTVKTTVMNCVADLRATWVELSVVPIIAVVLGFVFLAFVHKCAAVVIWVFLLLVMIIPAALGVWLLQSPKEQYQQIGFDLNKQGIDPVTAKYISYGCFGFSGLVFLMSICACSTISALLTVLRATSQFLLDVPSQLIQPIFFGVAQLCAMAMWLACFILVVSIGLSQDKQEHCLKVGNFYCVEWNSNNQTYVMIYCVLMLYWITNYLHAISHYGTAFAVYEWYFSEVDAKGHKKIEKGHTCCDFRLSIKSVCRGFIKHSGTFAFGAFVVSLAKTVYVCLLWAKRKEMASANPVTSALAKASTCVAKFVEKFIEFVSENAYVEVAIRNMGFCEAARKALALAVENPLLFGLVNYVGTFVRMLGVFLVSSLTAAIIFGVLKWHPPSGLNSIITPIAGAFIVAFVIAEVMMHPFSVAARAAVHCYCFDKEISAADSLHTPKEMRSLVEEKSDEGGDGKETPRKCCCCC